MSHFYAKTNVLRRGILTLTYTYMYMCKSNPYYNKICQSIRRVNIHPRRYNYFGSHLKSNEILLIYVTKCYDI